MSLAVLGRHCSNRSYACSKTAWNLVASGWCHRLHEVWAETDAWRLVCVLGQWAVYTNMILSKSYRCLIYSRFYDLWVENWGSVLRFLIWRGLDGLWIGTVDSIDLEWAVLVALSFLSRRLDNWSVPEFLRSLWSHPTVDACSFVTGTSQAGKRVPSTGPRGAHSTNRRPLLIL